MRMSSCTRRADLRPSPLCWLLFSQNMGGLLLRWYGWNATLRTITLQSNHWRLSELTTDVQRCEGSADASGCLGGSSIGACVEGQGGPRCMVCATKHHSYDETDGFCDERPAAGDATANYVQKAYTTCRYDVILELTSTGASVHS